MTGVLNSEFGRCLGLLKVGDKRVCPEKYSSADAALRGSGLEKTYTDQRFKALSVGV